MGSVHDEEPDCCKDKNCLCNTCADSVLFTNMPFMQLRKSGTARIATGAILGFILGIIISTAKPIKPTQNLCGTPGEFTITPNGGCNSYFSVSDSARTQLQHVLLRRDFSLCVDISLGKNTLAELGKTCTDAVPTLKFDTYTGKESRLCVGEKKNKTITSADKTYGTLHDNANCDNFKASFIMGDDAESDWFIWEAYVKNVPTPDSNPSSGKDYCLNANTSSLTFLSDGQECDYKLPTLKETVIGSASIMQQHTSDAKVYEDVIKYMFFVTGKIWLRILNLVVMPLLAANIITSVAQLRETSANGSVKLAWMTALYYITTTVSAAIESLILVNIMIIPFLKPIADVDIETIALPSASYANPGEQIKSVFTAIVPGNIVAETMKGGYLGIIFFSITIGAVVGLESKFLKFFSDLNTMMLRMVRLLILWTPLGVALLVTYVIAHHDLLHVVNNVGLFLATVFVGLFLHLFVVYPLLYFFLTRKNPYAVIRNIIPAMVMALSISSSIATYPYTLQCATTKNKFNHDISKFVLTLGATINMDGTTIGFPIAVVFVAYAQGYTLTLGNQLLIVILSTVSSMGAAPVPQSGLVLLIAIIDSLGIPLGSVFTLIMAVDWLYDRPETMVNICGDSFAAGVMHHYLHEEFEAEKKKKDEQQGISS